MNVEVNCSRCGILVAKDVKELNRQNKVGSGNVYCGRECQRKSMETHVELVCSKCGKQFQKQVSQVRSNENFCTVSCSVSYWNSKREIKKTKTVTCPICQKTQEVYFGKSNDSPCLDCVKSGITVEVECVDCKGKFTSIKKNWHQKKKYCPKCLFERKSKHGTEQGKRQTSNMRSANEIAFAKLCKEKFDSVLENAKLFDGWDADVVLTDQKVAVLWNGPWHYKQIKSRHNLQKVQNRDAIKIKEIEKAGYKAYVIRDDGSSNTRFVKSEFDKFVTWLELV